MTAMGSDSVLAALATAARPLLLRGNDPEGLLRPRIIAGPLV